MIQKSTLTGEPMVPVLYCDIDGTIRYGFDELDRFVNKASDVQVYSEVPDLLWRYKKLGCRIVGVSNQGGIALGHLTFADCRKAMDETHRQTSLAFDRIAWCPHHPDAEHPEMSVCWCRKPKAGLLIESGLSLAEQTGEIYPPHLGLFVGDRPEDKQCAENAGLAFLDAEMWRSGEHIAMLEEAWSTDRDTSISMSVSQANQPEGIWWKSMKAVELEVGDPFWYSGKEYIATLKDDQAVRGESAGEESRIFFANPAHARGPATPSWAVTVYVHNPEKSATYSDPNAQHDAAATTPVPDEILAASLEMTGVKTKKVRVCDLELEAEFVYKGLLYTIVDKGSLIIRAKSSSDRITFRNPFSMAAGSTEPSWWCEVLTDDTCTQPMTSPDHPSNITT